MACEHANFAANVNCIRFEDKQGYMAEVTIQCQDCGVPFRFLGLPPGIDFGSPTVSVDALTVHLPIAPQGEVVSFLDGAPQGFSIRKVG